MSYRQFKQKVRQDVKWLRFARAWHNIGMQHLIDTY